MTFYSDSPLEYGISSCLRHVLPFLILYAKLKIYKVNKLCFQDAEDKGKEADNTTSSEEPCNGPQPLQPKPTSEHSQQLQQTASFDESKQTQVSPLVAKSKVEPVRALQWILNATCNVYIYSFGFHNQISL